MHLHAGERLYFPCSQWLARDVGDVQIARTLAASRTDPHDSLQAYVVEVVTSNLKGAGTTAGVSLRLHGDLEVSSIQHLKVRTWLGSACLLQVEPRPKDVFACLETGDCKPI